MNLVAELSVIASGAAHLSNANENGACVEKVIAPDDLGLLNACENYVEEKVTILYPTAPLALSQKKLSRPNFY